MSERQAQGRWFALVGIRLAGAAGAMLGLVLIARAYSWPQKALGVAIVLSALLLIAVVPKALAHRWRTPE
jgi:membrane protein YdbS with pleckstrin-like domain